MEAVNQEETQKQQQVFALIGVVLAILAFSMAVTSPWLQDALNPSTATIEDVVVEKALTIKEKLAAGLKGEDYKSIQGEDYSHWSDHLPLIAIVIGTFAIICGVVAFLRKEDSKMSGMAIALGASAIVAQYIIMAVAAILFLYLLYIIIGQGGLPF